MSEQSDRSLVDRAAWLKARQALLAREKELTRLRDDIADQRRRLPLVRIDEPYAFETERGLETLTDLFKGHSQLVVYHFMFGADWDEGCPSCSFWMDNFNGITPHLAARDVSFVAVSTAPLEKLQAYKRRLGWNFDWASSGGGRFNMDFGVTFPDRQPGPTDGYNYSGQVFGEEMPGVSVFRLFDNGTIGHSYSTFARGLDILNGAYQLLDLTPKGRDEADLSITMAWVKRRDQYSAPHESIGGIGAPKGAGAKAI